MKRVLFVILAVLTVATACIYAIFAHDLGAARARLVGRSKTVETSFGTLEYAVMGEGEPMLIVHGAEGGFDQGIDMTGTMSGCGYRLIVPSRFGYLRSTMPDNPSTPMQSDAYAQLLDHLGIDKRSLLASLLAPGRPCSSPSVIRIAAVRWYFSSPPITCRQGRRSMAAPSSAPWPTPISSPGTLETDAGHAWRNDSDDARHRLRRCSRRRPQGEARVQQVLDRLQPVMMVRPFTRSVYNSVGLVPQLVSTSRFDCSHGIGKGEIALAEVGCFTAHHPCPSWFSAQSCFTT